MIEMKHAVFFCNADTIDYTAKISLSLSEQLQTPHNITSCLKNKEPSEMKTRRSKRQNGGKAGGATLVVASSGFTDGARKVIVSLCDTEFAYTTSACYLTVTVNVSLFATGSSSQITWWLYF